MYGMPSDTSKNFWTDAHFHLFARGQAFAGARYVPAYDADYEAWRAAAGAAGVRRGVLVQPSFLGTDNNRLCRELSAHPDTLRGVAVIDPGWAPDRLVELHSCGVRGIRLNLSGVSHDLGPWRQAGGIWDAIARLGWHVELHTDVGALPQVLAQLPADLPLVVDHMAKPEVASAADSTIAGLVARARRAPVHVKLSGAYRLEGRNAGAVAQVLLGELGPQRLLWGSDWPCTNHEALADYPRLLGALEDWVGGEAAMSALTVNPAALYWATPPAS
jgi:predicted TIM-barrel fold metal-dependent hydrolase